MDGLSVVTGLDDQTTCAGSSPSESPHSRTDAEGSRAETLVSNQGRSHGGLVAPPSEPNRNLPGDDAAPTTAEGWPTLAKQMADVPQLEAFRRFRELQVKNMLYYQVEIALLEAELKKLEREGGAYSRWAQWLVEGQASEDPQACKHWDVIVKIRNLLREYNAALLQHAQIGALPEPDSGNVRCLRTWLRMPGGGDFKICGEGSDTWGDQMEDDPERDPLAKRILPLLVSLVRANKPPPLPPDLVAVEKARTLDGAARWVKQEWIPFWHEWRYGRRPAEEYQTTVKTYSESAILKFTSRLAMVVACVLPTVAIGILTTADGNFQKLAYIAAFTAMFSIGLMALTEAGTSRVQIFTGTAAFSAVLVVFVQNQTAQ